MQKGIDLILSYSERSYIGGSKHVEERAYLLIEDDTEYMQERIETFKKQVKKAFTLFKKDGIFDLDMYFEYAGYYGDKRRFNLVHQSLDDYNNDVFELYTYSLEVYSTDVNKVSKQAAIKAIFARIDKLVEEALQEAAA